MINNIFILVSIFLMILSFLGYALAVKKVIGLSQEFIPIFVFSFIALFVYFFGLLDMLLLGSFLTLILGITFLVVFLSEINKSNANLKIHVSFSEIAFLLGGLLFFSLLLGSKLTHYDNFSHWGIVVKQMLSTNAFPTIESNLIEFKNYPLGISSFIYFVSLFAGKSQPSMVIAQSLLIFSCFYSIFGILVTKKRFLLYAVLGLGLTTLSFFNITIRINNLLVDFLLPIYTLSVFAIAYRYRNQPNKAFIGTVPLLGLLTIIKSTGIIFATIGILFLFYIVFINRKQKSKILVITLALFTLFVTVIPYVAWSVHVNNNFITTDSKFDLQNLPSKKTIVQIEEITESFIQASIDVSTRPTIGILAFNIIAVIVIIFNATILKKKWNLWKALISLNIVLILYYAGIWAMYIFSMPLDEAIVLAGFERYASSIVVLFVGGLTLVATIDIENSFYYQIGEVADEKAFKSVKSKNLYQKSVLVCIAVSATLLLSEYSGISSIQKEYDTTLANKICEITGDRWYPMGKQDNRNYLFYASDNESQVTNYYMQYIGRYYLYAPNVDGIVLFYEDNMDNLLSHYDYLVVVESDYNERYLLKKNYGVDGKPGIYKVVNSNGKIKLQLEGNQ